MPDDLERSKKMIKGRKLICLLITAVMTVASMVPAMAEEQPSASETQTTTDTSPTGVKYDVIINKEDGIKNVYGAGEYFPGEKVTINAEQKNGYVFHDWYVTYENPYTHQTGSFYLMDRKTTFTMPDGHCTILAESEVLSPKPNSATDDSPKAMFDYSIRSIPENGDAPGAVWFPFMLRLKKATKTAITLKWKSVPGACGYAVYGASCGSRYRYITKVNVPTYRATGLTFGKYYKYFVAALDGSGNPKAKSTTVHIVTKGGKYGNYSKVKFNKKSLKLKVGQETKVRANTTVDRKKKAKTHKKLKYFTTNKFVARVYSSGRILATGKGTCYIYAYTQDGKYAKMKVKVKKK